MNESPFLTCSWCGQHGTRRQTDDYRLVELSILRIAQLFAEEIKFELSEAELFLRKVNETNRGSVGIKSEGCCRKCRGRSRYGNELYCSSCLSGKQVVCGLCGSLPMTVAEAKAISKLVKDLNREAEIRQEALDDEYNSGDHNWDPEQGWIG